MVISRGGKFEKIEEKISGKLMRQNNLKPKPDKTRACAYTRDGRVSRSPVSARDRVLKRNTQH